MSSMLDDSCYLIQTVPTSAIMHTSYQNLLLFRYTVELQSVLLTKNKIASI